MFSGAGYSERALEYLSVARSPGAIAPTIDRTLLWFNSFWKAGGGRFLVVDSDLLTWKKLMLLEESI